MPKVDYGNGVLVDWTEKEYTLIREARARRQAEAHEEVPVDRKAAGQFYYANPKVRARVDAMVEEILKGGRTC